MKIRTVIALAVTAAALAACQNKNEAEADKITRAVIANDMTPVMGDFDPAIKGQITRVKVAELSDELNAQGAYRGVKEDDSSCPAGYLCFVATFDKRPYHEQMKVGSDGKVQYWFTHAAR